jgi:hypothetical protein
MANAATATTIERNFINTLSEDMAAAAYRLEWTR